MAPKVKSTAPRAYLLKGDDDFSKGKDVEALLAFLVAPAFADFDMEQIEASAATADRIVSGLNIPPFGSRQRVVLIKQANKINEDEQEKLAAVLEKTPETGCLLLVTPAPERVDGKPRKGSEVIGELSKAIRRIGEVRDFGGFKGKEKATQSRQFAEAQFAEAGKKLDPRAMALFVQRTGSDLYTIKTEAEKLIAYSGDSARVTPEDVAQVTSETPEEKVFKLIDAVVGKNQAAALKFIDEVFAAGDGADAQAPKTLGTVTRQFRLLWQAKMFHAAGLSLDRLRKDSVPDEIKAALPAEPNVLEVVSRQSWMGDRLDAQARPLSRAELARCFAAIARADRMLKGIEGDIDDPKLVMELLVMELARPVQRVAGR